MSIEGEAVNAAYFIHWEQRALTAERKLVELRAENERLRAFAQYVADMDPDNPAPLFERARATLEPKPWAIFSPSYWAFLLGAFFFVLDASICVGDWTGRRERDGDGVSVTRAGSWSR
jgi:hypothetical protein